MGGNYFTNPKDVSILTLLMSAIGLKNNDIVFDFFSGSGSTAQAVLQFNVNSGNNCSYIMVQLQEDLDESLAKATGSSVQVLKNAIELCDTLKRPHFLTEIGKERIRRAGIKIKNDAGLLAQNLDIGFRVLKVDNTNMQDVYYTPGTYQQNLLNSLADNIKPDRMAEDLLFQVMLDLGILLSSSIQEILADGKKVYSVADGYLLACFDNNVNSETITEIAKQKPYYAVFRDSSMSGDSVATNFEQIFATHCPTTVRKVL